MTESAFPLILKPDKLSEFEMQATLWVELKRLGYDVRGEVPATWRGTKSHFDLVIFVGGQGALIIEVKNSRADAIRHGKKTRQTAKYRDYGLPLVFYTSATPLESVIEQINQHLR